MVNKQTAVECLEDSLRMNFNKIFVDTDFGLISHLIKQAKEIEKEQIKEELIGLLQWMNKVAETNPMAFETDSNDIVEMYLNGYYK